MSPGDAHAIKGPLRTLAAGSLDGDTWLVGWFAQPDGSGVVIVAAGAAPQVLEAQLDDDWGLRAAGVALEVQEAGDPVPLGGDEEPAGGFEQPIEVTLGAVQLAGRRGERDDLRGSLDSVRELSAWFGPGQTIAVNAARPRKHKGHESDSVRAGVAEPQGTAAIVDARLSTTYAADGRPIRVGLELWSDDEDRAAIRLSAEARGTVVQASQAGWELTATPLRCHREDVTGAGVYLLARPS